MSSSKNYQARYHVFTNLLTFFSGEPVEDENGYSHLLPNSQHLRAADTCLAAVKESLVSLVFCRKTDHGGGTS